jgi:hypothetical protein
MKLGKPVKKRWSKKMRVKPFVAERLGSAALTFEGKYFSTACIPSEAKAGDLDRRITDELKPVPFNHRSD